MPIIGGVKCILGVAHPNQNFGWAGGRPTLQRHHGVYRDHCKLTRRPAGFGAPSTQSHFAVLYARKTYLVAAFLVVYGQHCNEWQNESQSRLTSNLVSAGNLRHDKLHSRSNWQINFCRVQNCGPPKFCGPVRPNTSNMLKAGPDKTNATDLSSGVFAILIR